MVNYRSAIIVPRDSPLRGLADLRGRTIATAFGSTTHRDAVRELADAGLSATDVHLVNLDQAEHAAVIGRGGAIRWGNIDAIATYDPTIAIANDRRLARTLKEWTSHGVVVASDDVVRRRRVELERFLEAYAQAFNAYAQNPSRFDSLYAEDSRLPLSRELYSVMAAPEPSLRATSPAGVTITLDSVRQRMLQRDAEIAFNLGILKKPLSVVGMLDLQIADRISSPAATSR
jgi:ABC-type nitrate/sulfonate/bicarbonate transport system substrate-binding protein